MEFSNNWPRTSMKRHQLPEWPSNAGNFIAKFSSNLWGNRHNLYEQSVQISIDRFFNAITMYRLMFMCLGWTFTWLGTEINQTHPCIISKRNNYTAQKKSVNTIFFELHCFKLSITLNFIFYVHYDIWVPFHFKRLILHLFIDVVFFFVINNKFIICFTVNF